MEKKNNFVLFLGVVFEIFSVIIFVSRTIIFVTSADSTMVKVILSVLLISLFVIIICFYNILIKKFNFDRVKQRIKKLNTSKMIVIIILMSLLLKIVSLFLFKIDSSKHPDIKVYWSFINQLVNNGQIKEYAEYAINFPYTVIFSTLFYLPAKLFSTNSILYMNLYVIFWFTICSVLLFDLIKFYKGKNIAFIAVMLWNVLPLGVFEPLLLVHENSLVVLHIITLWVLFRLVPSTQNKMMKLAWTLFGIFTISFSAMINKFAIISIIAIIILYFIRFVYSENRIRELVRLLSIILVFLAVFEGCTMLKNSIIENYVDRSDVMTSDSYRLPYGWTLYLGSNYEKKGYWNQEDRDRYIKYQEFDNYEEAKNYQVNLIKTREEFLLKNPLKLITHINNKIGIIWDDFNPVESDFGGSFNKFVLNWHSGIIKSLFYYFQKILDILFSFVIMMSFRKKTKINKVDLNLYFKLFTMGTTFVLLPLEVMPKYSSHLLFIYLAIMVFGLKDFDLNMRKISNKITGLIKKK